MASSTYMSSETRTVRLPEELCAAAEERFGRRFGTINELLVFVLRELVRLDSAEMDESDRRIVEQRLRDLGYV
jgi:hypothetical protein